MAVAVAETVSVATATDDDDDDEHVLTIATRDISTSTTNLIHLTTNGTDPTDDAADHHHQHQTSVLNDMDQDQRVNSFELIEHLQSLANDCDQHSHAMQQQTKSIIEDNINLRIR